MPRRPVYRTASEQAEFDEARRVRRAASQRARRAVRAQQKQQQQRSATEHQPERHPPTPPPLERLLFVGEDDQPQQHSAPGGSTPQPPPLERSVVQTAGEPVLSPAPDVPFDIYDDGQGDDEGPAAQPVLRERLEVDTGDPFVVWDSGGGGYRGQSPFEAGGERSALRSPTGGRASERPTGTQLFPIWDDALQRPVLHVSPPLAGVPRTPQTPVAIRRTPRGAAAAPSGAAVPTPTAGLASAIGSIALATPLQRGIQNSATAAAQLEAPRATSPMQVSSRALSSSSGSSGSSSGSSSDSSDSSDISDISDSSDISESSDSSESGESGGHEHDTGAPLTQAFIDEGGSDGDREETARRDTNSTRGIPVVRFLGDDESYGRSTGSSSEAGTGRPAAAQASPYSQRLLVQSFRYHGCTCTRTALGRSHAASAEGLSLSAFTRRWSAAHNIPDVVAAVAEHHRLPAIAASSISPAVWKALLAGVDSAGDANRLVLSLDRSCLAGRGRPVSITRTWDIDALIVPLLSLGACKNGISLFYNPRYTKTITADWHTPITDLAISPRRCKHLRFARYTGPIPTDIYIFFPALPVAERPKGAVDPMQDRARCYPTHEEQAEWIDRIVLPALREVYPPHILQHHPRSFGESSGRSRARQKESITASERNVSETADFLPNSTTGDTSELGRFWRAVLRRAREWPRFADIRAVMVTYNCKLQHRSTDLAGLRRQLDNSLDRSFERSDLSLNAAYVDLAYEDIATPVDRDEPPLVCIRRSSCNLADMHGLGMERSSQLFNWTGTADASAIRASPGTRSALRKGGVAYVQAYNLQKDMFTLPDRSSAPAFSDPALPALGFGQSALDEFRATGRSGVGDLASHRRALRALRAVIERVQGIIQDNRSSPTGFGARQEYRISWSLFQTVPAPSTAQPDLETRNHHWPFFILRKSEVCDFVYWQLNRWLLVVCVTLTAHRPVPVRGLPATDLLGQGQNSAMLAVAFACLDLTINSGAVNRYSRLSKERYYTGGRKRSRGSNRLVGNSMVYGGARDNDEDPHGNWDDRLTATGSEDSTAGPGGHTRSRFRRGLGFELSLRSTNLLWLPVDLFLWDMCTWRPEKLLQTAFVTDRFRRQSRQPRKAASDELDTAFRLEVDRALEHVVWVLPDRSNPAYKEAKRAIREVRWTLWELCIWRFVYELLQRLRETQYMPGLSGTIGLQDERPVELGAEDLLGLRGLHYRLIFLAADEEPYLSIPRGSGGQATTGGFSSFDLDWRTRCQLLFDWDDDFTLRRPWENSSWRVWTRFCYRRLSETGGSGQARRWKLGIGTAAAQRLFMLPKYDDKLFRPERITRRDDSTGETRRLSVKVLKWLAAQPIRWKRAEGPEDCQWQLLCRIGSAATPVHLPKIWLQRPDLLSGIRFTRLGEVEQAAMAIHQRQMQAPAAAQGVEFRPQAAES